MLVHIYNNNTQKTDLINTPLTHLHNFYVAFARVHNGAIDTYATNSGHWFPEFLKLWKDDPIVSKSYAHSHQLRLGEWNFKSTQTQHLNYIKHRAQLTGAHQGFTAYRTNIHEGEVYSEFYALGFSNENEMLEKMLNRDFSLTSLTDIFNFFNNGK